MDTSYAYLVSSDGTMLYHPTQDKVGSAVENSVVKGLVADLQAGQHPQDAVVSYDFNGAIKYAGYSILSDNSILVITADESEALARAVTQMRKNLRGMVDQINNVDDVITTNIDALKTTSELVNSNCTDNSATTQELAAGMQETAASTETIQTSITEMKASNSFQLMARMTQRK